jgi:hypothetical protein
MKAIQVQSYQSPRYQQVLSQMQMMDPADHSAVFLSTMLLAGKRQPIPAGRLQGVANECSETRIAGEK